MNRHKEVGFGAVGYVGTLVKRYEHIGTARIHHPNVGASLLYVSSESQCNVQIDAFLIDHAAGSANVVTSMTRINDECELLPSTESYRKRQQQRNE